MKPRKLKKTGKTYLLDVREGQRGEIAHKERQLNRIKGSSYFTESYSARGFSYNSSPKFS